MRRDTSNVFSRLVRRLRDVLRLVVVHTGPVSRRRRRPRHRYVERRDAEPPLEDELGALTPPRALGRRFRESDVPPLLFALRRWRRGCHYRRRWRRGQRRGGGRVARALRLVVYTWVWVLLCTGSPSVVPIAFAGA